jgi:hypothetical protein
MTFFVKIARVKNLLFFSSVQPLKKGKKPADIEIPGGKSSQYLTVRIGFQP